MTVATPRRRAHPAVALFILAAAAAAVALLWLGQGLTFFADEWAVIEGRSLDLDSFIRPFNEHWLGTTVIAYRALLVLVGLGSYVPYLGLLIGLHLLVSGEVFVLVRRAGGAWLGLAAGVVVLFFGSGFENLYWAMQIGFVGAVALGLGAMLVLDGDQKRAVETSGAGPRWHAIALATVLLSLGVASSGIGLVMLAAVAVEIGLDIASRKRHAATLLAGLIPAAIYIAWFAAFDRGGVGTARNPFSLGALAEVPAFVVDGAGAAAGAVTGLGPTLGLIVFGAVVVSIVWRFITRRPVPSRALGCLAGIVALYILTGLIRAQLVVDAALYTRYLYVSGILFVLALASLGGPALRAWMAGSGSTRRLALAGVGVLLALALSWNVRLLIAGRDIFMERADRTRALVTVALQPLPAGVEPDRTLILIPSPESVGRIVGRYGSPLADALVIGRVQPVPADALADARRRLQERAGVLGPLPQ